MKLGPKIIVESQKNGVSRKQLRVAISTKAEGKSTKAFGQAFVDLSGYL
jgi:hypothetical protein